MEGAPCTPDGSGLTRSQGQDNTREEVGAFPYSQGLLCQPVNLGTGDFLNSGAVRGTWEPGNGPRNALHTVNFGPNALGEDWIPDVILSAPVGL